MPAEQVEEKKPIPKWKVALIPALGVTLIVVLIPKADAKPAATLQSAAVSLKTDPSAQTARGKNLTDLPVGTVESASQFNPFNMGEPLLNLTRGAKEEAGPSPEEIAAQLQKEQEEELRRQQKAALIEQIKKLNVSLVIQTDQGVAAIIDSKTVYVGDEVYPGVVVSHIGQDGLRVRLKDGEPATSAGNPESAEK